VEQLLFHSSATGLLNGMHHHPVRPHWLQA